MKEGSLTIIAIFSILMIGFALSGCVGQPPALVEEEDKGGMIGLTPEFAPSAPPRTIFVDELFDIIVTLKNEGGYDVNTSDASIFIHGVDLSVYNAANNANYVSDKGYLNKILDFELLKATLGEDGTIPGGIGDVSFGNLTRGSYGIAEGGKSSDEFFATVCYKYQTEDKASVCLGKPSIAKEAMKAELACEPGKAEKPIAVGAGSPIRVTKVEVYPLSTGTNFIIDIENKGDGDVFWVIEDITTNWGKCMDLKPGELNKVNVVKIMAGSDEICADSYKTVTMRKESGKITGQIRCTEASLSTEMISSPTPKDLVVTLEYYYKDQTSQEVTIKRVG